MDKHYDAKVIENKWEEQWKNQKLYKYEPDPKKPTFSIDTPPPTISGYIHLGHLFSYVQQDFIARYYRMRGYNVLYPFGFDDNGIASERFVENELGVRARDMDRRKFVELCLKTTRKAEKKMIALWNRLGVSTDWSLLYRTIDPKVQRLSQLSFVKLYKMGREYRKEGPNFWCPQCSTAVSQVELKDLDIKSKFVDIVFNLENEKGQIKIATTRPELLAACVSIFVHPEDKKNAHLVGKKAVVPLFGQKVPIMKDKRVDMEKGTGIVMCCTFGDQTDVDWYYAYNLPLKVAIDKEGNMTELAGKYKGMYVVRARKKIIEDLKKEGRIKGIREIRHTVNTHERCGTEIEFLVTKQWFIKYLDLKPEFLKAGKEFKWYPKHMRVRYDNWVKGLQWDWCISRQRYFGIPFPVWYCKKCGKEIIAGEEQLPVDPLVDAPTKKCECESGEFEPEKDVLDTWATSSLTPLINCGWDGEKTNRTYPMTLRPQGHDIISFWLFNTVVKCLFHTKQLPFRDVVINGMVLDPEGRKMSKSKGNVILPEDLLNKYPVDAVRFWAAGSKMGEDIPFKEKDIITGQKFMIKLWNAARFINSFLEGMSGRVSEMRKLEKIDKWILNKVAKLIKRTEKDFESYEYSKIKNNVRESFWHDFCDNYLEIVKHRLYSSGSKSLGSSKRSGKPESTYRSNPEAALFTLYTTLLAYLKMIAPIMPFLTEEIYTCIFKRFEKEKSIHLSKWPEFQKIHYDREEKAGDEAIEIIEAVRKFKSDNNLPLNAPIRTVKINKKVEMDEVVKSTLKIEELKVSPVKDRTIIGKVKLNYAKIGPKYGPLVRDIALVVSDPKNVKLKGEKLSLKTKGKKILLDSDEFSIKEESAFKSKGHILKTDRFIIEVVQ